MTRRPYLKGGEIIPMKRNSIPLSAETLLQNLDSLVTSVNLKNLRTTVDELGKAFNGRGPDLGSLLDSNHDLLDAAEQNLPQTIALIEQSGGVLQTQLDLHDPIYSWAHNLDLLSGQLKKSDPDIRRLLDNGPSSLGVVRTFVQDNRTDLGVTLANLATLGTLMVRHLDGLEEVLELYPALAAGGQSVIRSNQTATLGLVTQTTPRDCGDPTKGSEGYQGTVLRSPSDLSPAAPNVAAHCSAPQSSGVNVRGRPERAGWRSDERLRRRRRLSSRHHPKHPERQHPPGPRRDPRRQGVGGLPDHRPALSREPAKETMTYQSVETRPSDRTRSGGNAPWIVAGILALLTAALVVLLVHTLSVRSSDTGSTGASYGLTADQSRAVADRRDGGGEPDHAGPQELPAPTSPGPWTGRPASCART